MYFGESLLDSQSVDSIGLSSGGAILFQATFNNSFSWKLLDLTEYDIEQETGGYPHAVLQVYCVNTTVTPGDPAATSRGEVAVGWVQVSLYERTVSSLQWQLLAGHKTCTLTAGHYAQDNYNTHTFIGNDIAREQYHTGRRHF